MPTLYCDFENGNDNHGGTSFALLAQGTNGRISSATFSSAGASFPNDGSLIGQYLSIFNGTSYLTYNITAWVSSTSLTIAQISGGDALANQAVDRQYFIGGRWKSLTNGATAARLQPGDTVRIMGSPAPTSLGQNGVWTSQALQATKSISSSTNATPIAITCTAHGYSTGDTVVITGHTTNTNANGTWEITVTGANTFTLDGSTGNGVGGASGSVRLRNNTRVMLTTAVTQNIASTGPGRAAWTAVAGGNVTTSFTTTAQKEGINADRIVITTEFTTGKAAYWTLPNILDLSEYQQVSFWYRSELFATINAGVFELRLCSDATGDVSVNTIPIPAQSATSRFMPVTVDLGSNLGTNIASIALYVASDTTAQNIILNNIIACKASSAPDSLTLTSLIGKNTTGETFWGIQSINGRRVMLDADTNATPTSTTVRGYYGTSETVTTWKRETIKLGPALASTTALQTIQDSGTDGNPITFSGGWDRTNMSTQSLETWLDGVNGNGYGIEAGTLGFYTISIMAAVRFARGFSLGSPAYSGVNLSLVAINNNTGAGAATFSASGTANIQAMCANASSSFIGDSAGPQRVNLGQVISNGAAVSSVASGPNSTLTGNFYNTAGFGFRPGSTAGLKLLNCKFADNSSGAIQINGTTAYGIIYLRNCLLSNSWDISQSGLDAYIYSHNHDQTAGNHKIFMSGALISAATDQRHTASGISWKIQPTSTNRSSAWPVTLSLAKVAAAANSLVTIKAWMRRDNSGLTMRLVCKGGQIAGVANDVVAAVTTTNAWEEETITFTPTEVGVVEITAEAWGGTTFSGWVDDMTITQA